jgi:hypothetical protein
LYHFYKITIVSQVRQFKGNFLETSVDEFRRKVVVLYIELFHRTFADDCHNMNVMPLPPLSFLIFILPNIPLQLCIALDTVHFTFIEYYKSEMIQRESRFIFCIFFITRYRASVFILTYVGYTCYHLSRKPISVVKNVLNQNCSQCVPPPDVIINDTNKDNWCDWAPFGKL